MALGPKARLQHERESDSSDDNAPWTGQCTNERSNNEEKEQADHKDGPLDHRTVDEFTPLIPGDHRIDVGPEDCARKDLRVAVPAG